MVVSRHLPSHLWTLVLSFAKWEVAGTDVSKAGLTWASLHLPPPLLCHTRTRGSPHLSGLHALPSPILRAQACESLLCQEVGWASSLEPHRKLLSRGPLAQRTGVLCSAHLPPTPTSPRATLRLRVPVGEGQESQSPQSHLRGTARPGKQCPRSSYGVCLCVSTTPGS